jgi:hypothetical protein
LVPDDAGGEGLSSPEACAGVSRGTAISAIVNIASVKSLIANLFIHRSRFSVRSCCTRALRLEHPDDQNIPEPSGFIWAISGRVISMHRPRPKDRARDGGPNMTIMSSR